MGQLIKCRFFIYKRDPYSIITIIVEYCLIINKHSDDYDLACIIRYWNGRLHITSYWPDDVLKLAEIAQNPTAHRVLLYHSLCKRIYSSTIWVIRHTFSVKQAMSCNWGLNYDYWVRKSFRNMRFVNTHISITAYMIQTVYKHAHWFPFREISIATGLVRNTCIHAAYMSFLNDHPYTVQ